MADVDKILKHVDAHIKSKGFAPTKADLARKFTMTKQGIDYYFNTYADKFKKYPEYLRYFGPKKKTK